MEIRLVKWTGAVRMMLFKNKTFTRNILVYALFILLAACASSEMLFIDPNMDFGAIRTVAIMPFENLSNAKTGADRVRDVFTNRLLFTGAIYAIPPGEVSRAALRAGVVIPSSPSVEEIIKLAAIAKVDAVITGVVREYGSVRSGGATANLVSFSLKLIESKSGRIVAMASSRKGGVTIKDRLAGGSVQPLNDITEEAVDDIINKYFKSYSMRDKEHEKMPIPVSLMKSENIVKTKDSLGKENKKRQKVKEKEEALRVLKEVEKPVNKIVLIGKSSAFIDNALDSALKDQNKTQELNEAEEKITEPRNESPLLKEKKDVQEIKQNNDTIEASSNKNDKNTVRARPDKEIGNTNKIINNLKVDSQFASKTIYTIQTGSFLKMERAQKQFNSMLQKLNGKEINFLRIEKIGKYFSVRLGRFNDYYTAKQFVIAAKPNLSSAVILKAYIKEERIIRFNAASVSALNKSSLILPTN